LTSLPQKQLFSKNFEKIWFKLSQQHLLHFYLSVIRPVLEYCSVVWHHSLSKTQCESLEYIFALSYAHIPSLHSRHEDANKRFLGLFLTHPPAFFPCYLHKEIALLLLDYDLQLSSASYQNKMFYIFSSVFSVKLSIDLINKFFLFFCVFSCGLYCIILLCVYFTVV